MTRALLLAFVGLAGAFVPAASALAQTAPAFLYTATVNKRTVGYNGKGTTEKPLVFQTIVSGQRARAEIVEGEDGDMKPGDLLLTTDGGRTIHWVSSRKREYTAIDAAFKDRLSNEIASKLKLKLSDGRVDETPATADGTLDGRAVMHSHIARSTRMSGRMLLIKYDVAYEDTLDVWTARDFAGLPAVEATFFETVIDAFIGSSPALSADTAAAKAKRPAGLPLKWTHVSRTTKDDGEAEEKTTAIVISRLKQAAAGGVSFDVPAGYRRVDKL